MFPVRDDFWFLPFPPLRDSSGCLALQNILPVSSLLSSLFLPSVHNAYSAAPLQCLVPPIVCPPSSVRRRATNPLAPADQCPLLVPRPSVPYAGLHPPRLVRLVLLGLGVGGGPKETAPPAVVLSPSSCRQASPADGQVHAYARRSISLLSSCGSCLVFSPSSRQAGSTCVATGDCLQQRQRSTSLLILEVPVSPLSAPPTPPRRIAM